MPERNSDILIMVPAYNAGKYLDELITRVTKAVPEAELLIIDDGSSDDTREVLESHSVTVLVNDPNRGKGYTLERGFRYGREQGYSHVITIDADLQHLPEELPGFIKIRKQYEVVIGTRDIDLKIMPFARWITNNLTSIIISIFAGRRVRDSQSGYRMYSTDLVGRFKTRSFRYDYESEQLLQTGLLGARVGEVAVTTVYEGSESSINPFRDTLRFIRLLWQKLMT